MRLHRFSSLSVSGAAISPHLDSILQQTSVWPAWHTSDSLLQYVAITRLLAGVLT